MDEPSYPFESWWYRNYANQKAEAAQRGGLALAQFEAAHRVFDGPPDFRERVIRGFLNPQELLALNAAVAATPISEWRSAQLPELGRWTVDNPHFAQAMHEKWRPWLSDLVGEELECSYTLLGLYTRCGSLPVHIDSPDSKWTIDICLRQSSVWPLHVSKVCDWRQFNPLEHRHANWEQDMKADASMEFRTAYMQPGDAVVFCSSTQWHWRDAIPQTSGDAYCDMLFLSYAPAGFNAARCD